MGTPRHTSRRFESERRCARSTPSASNDPHTEERLRIGLDWSAPCESPGSKAPLPLGMQLVGRHRGERDRRRMVERIRGDRRCGRSNRLDDNAPTTGAAARSTVVNWIAACATAASIGIACRFTSAALRQLGRRAAAARCIVYRRVVLRLRGNGLGATQTWRRQWHCRHQGSQQRGTASKSIWMDQRHRADIPDWQTDLLRGLYHRGSTRANANFSAYPRGGCAQLLAAKVVEANRWQNVVFNGRGVSVCQFALRSRATPPAGWCRLRVPARYRRRIAATASQPSANSARLDGSGTVAVASEPLPEDVSP